MCFPANPWACSGCLTASLKASHVRRQSRPRTRGEGLSTSRQFLEHPKTEALIREYFPIIAGESDRGAVLVGAELLNLHLGEFLGRRTLGGISERSLEKMSLFARNEAGKGHGLYADNIFDSIDGLRNIRNELAHSASHFRLRNEDARLNEILELLGTGVSGALYEFAAELLLGSVIHHVVEAGLKANELGELKKEVTPQDVIERLSELPEIVHVLEARLPRIKLAAGVILLCGVLISKGVMPT